MKIAVIGGHLSPALSVIDALPPEYSVIFLGRKYAVEGENVESYEYKTIKDKNIPFFAITTGRLQRTFTRHTLPSLGKIPVGLTQAFLILKKERPDVVISFGSYLSVPIAYAAALLRIPVIVHEQTLHAGQANRVVSKIANRICISWESSKAFFPSWKTVLTGNPLRKEVLKREKHHKKHTARPRIYITGGSTGSHAINVAIQAILPALLETYTVYHQAGDVKGYTSYSQLSETKTSLPVHLQEQYHLAAHYSGTESAELLSTVDLVISRSGINTVTELLYLNTVALLIPLPYGQKDEQLANAELFVKSGLGEYITQQTLTPEVLLTKITEMFASIDTYSLKLHQENNQRNMRAAEKIVEVLTDVTSNSTNT